MAITNAQAFLASLEALAPPTEAGQQLGEHRQGCLRTVSAAHPHACLCPRAPSIIAATAAEAQLGAHAKAHGLPVGSDTQDLHGTPAGALTDAGESRAAKRPCTGTGSGSASGLGGAPNGPLQQHLMLGPEGLANGGLGEGGQAQQHSGSALQQDGAGVLTGGLHWHSPLHGTVRLMRYGLAFAVLKFSSGSSREDSSGASGTGGGCTQQQQQQQSEVDVELELLVHWRQKVCFRGWREGAVEGVIPAMRGGRQRLRSGSGDADGCSSSSSGSGTAGQVQCCIVPVHTRQSMRAPPGWATAPPLGLLAAATPTQLAAWVHTLCAAGPVAELVDALAEWVDTKAAGEVLDALATCAGPMCRAAVWAAGVGVAEQGAEQQQVLGSGAMLQGQVVHLPGYGPYQHRMLVRQARSKGSGSGSLAAVTYLCIQMVCTSEGRTWLYIWVEGAAAAIPAALQSVQAELSAAPGYHVHQAAGLNKQLWVLVPSAAILEALSLCAKAWASAPRAADSTQT